MGQCCSPLFRARPRNDESWEMSIPDSHWSHLAIAAGPIHASMRVPPTALKTRPTGLAPVNLKKAGIGRNSGSQAPLSIQ